MLVRLIECLATTEPLAEIFSDDSIVKAMLKFEVALARAEARVGIIPQSAADTIAAVADASTFDTADLARATLRAGTPGIPLVKALTERVRAQDPAAACVHWGATSQDVVDSAFILLLKKVQPIFDSDLGKLERALEGLSARHQNTVMLGRTLMQAATPVTFGLKAAGWLAAIRRSRARLDSGFADALVVQFGGAAGTLAALREQGLSVAAGLAGELGLTCPDAPWHTHRDRLATLLCACGVLTATLGKIARDISLLMQNEVGEAAEPGGHGRGGSSTMPHKRNPMGCSITLAAAQRVPGLVGSFLSAMVQEHERGVGGWQAEWPIVSAIVQSTGLAIASMAEVAEGLTVDETRMRANIHATRGVIFAERAMIMLGKNLGRDVAHRLLEEATRQSVQQGRRLSEVLAEMPEITGHIEAKALSELETPEQYLGVAEELRVRLLSRQNQRNPERGRNSERERK